MSDWYIPYDYVPTVEDMLASLIVLSVDELEESDDQTCADCGQVHGRDGLDEVYWDCSRLLCKACARRRLEVLIPVAVAAAQQQCRITPPLPVFDHFGRGRALRRSTKRDRKNLIQRTPFRQGAATNAPITMNSPAPSTNMITP